MAAWPADPCWNLGLDLTLIGAGRFYPGKLRRRINAAERNVRQDFQVGRRSVVLGWAAQGSEVTAHHAVKMLGLHRDWQVVVRAVIADLR